MRNKLKECQIYVNSWDREGYVITVRMEGSDDTVEYIIQMLVVALLRSFLDEPPPEGFIEGSIEHAEWVDGQYRKTLHSLDPDLTKQEEDAVKNLAWNYYVEGVSKVLATPALKERVFKCYRIRETSPTQH